VNDARITIANAPCSYGAFELTVGVDPLVPPALELLDAVAGAGYAGIDLGPLGYLGGPRELATRLKSRGLSLAGGYFEIAFNEPSGLGEALARLDSLLDTFDAAPGGGTPPRPTLADAGSAARRAGPGRAQQDRSLGWDSAAWHRFADDLARVVERCRERGYEPTFHPHTATYVEAPWEIDRLLELSSVGICLDTGHLLLAGGDPVAVVGDWGGRINHVHLKDARLAVIERIVADAAPVEAIWRRRAFCRLGAGDVAVDAVLDALRAASYRGWLIVEQDFIPDPTDDPGAAARDQAANRAYLAGRGL
jgi:inosose dehydratase